MLQNGHDFDALKRALVFQGPVSNNVQAHFVLMSKLIRMKQILAMLLNDNKALLHSSKRINPWKAYCRQKIALLPVSITSRRLSI
jgi:hypothetical protein